MAVSVRIAKDDGRMKRGARRSRLQAAARPGITRKSRRRRAKRASPLLRFDARGLTERVPGVNVTIERKEAASS
jgi:hypothetical protein